VTLKARLSAHVRSASYVARHRVPRWFLVGAGVLVALVAYLQAWGTSAVLRGSLTRAPERAHAGPRRSPAAAPTVPRSASAILARNPFDSVTGPLTGNPEPPPGPPPPPPGTEDPLGAPHCADVRVVVTSEHDDPLESMAVIKASAQARGRIRRVGDPVGAMEVAFIGHNPLELSPAVWLLGAEGLCQSLLFAPPAQATPKKTHHEAEKKTKGKASKRGKGVKLPQSIAKRIERVGPGTYRIERTAVEAILAQGPGLMRSTRLKPAQANGKVVGFRLTRIPKGSLLDALGLEKGDQIRSVNGFALSGPTAALQAYARLRTADHISVKGVRKGKPMELEYRIQ
jgi:general secretion pathway protein C